MEILSVTLRNFKSHSDRHFVFQAGTNAICGENGAGKTTILEAIAWALFNYKGAYKNEDLIRNGAGSAQARIAFVSNRDGRTYEVERCTSKGYTLYDPQLAVRLEYKHIEDEIMPWLRQHFGVAPGTDLARLFANTIGVPQGTFTADFLKSPEDRKKVFDAVLKVEEYKQANQELLSLEKYAKAGEEMLDRAIAQYEEDLQALEPLQTRRQTISQEIAASEAALTQLQGQLSQLQAHKDRLATQAQQVQQIEHRLQTLNTQHDAKQQANTLLTQSVQRASQAVQRCNDSRSSYQAYLQAEAALKDLDQQLRQRAQLLKQRDVQQNRLADGQTQLTRLTLQLERFTKAIEERSHLQPLIVQQESLERQQTEIVNQLQQLQAQRAEQQTLMRQLTRVNGEIERSRREIERIQSLAVATEHIADLEQQRDRTQEQLTRVEAAKQFEADLRRLLEGAEIKRDRHQIQAKAALSVLQQMQKTFPQMEQSPFEAALLAIQAGVELNYDLLEALHQILSDVSEQTSIPRLKQQLHQLKIAIDAAYRQQAEGATLPARREQQQQLQEEARQIQLRLQQVEQALTVESELQQQRSHLTVKLAELSDPRSRSQLLAQELQQQDRVQSAYARAQAVQAEIQQAIAHLDEQLQQFAELEVQLEAQKQLRQVHQPGYMTYLQHQNDAAQLPQLEANLQQAIAQLQQLEAERLTLQANYQQLTQDYDPQEWLRVETAYTETRSQSDQLAGGLPQQRKLLDELNSQLAALKLTAEKRDLAKADLKKREKVRRFIAFARKAYKEAGPRITERYVQNISREADKLFRELMNRPNVMLEWTRDYEIIVREGAHTRRFINLSGGEQMCAALATRLALLRVMADIDIAFFDEPTTNMDRPRRESLAEAIANIKSFRQLFVISHDDTFEKVTENVILVEREP